MSSFKRIAAGASAFALASGAVLAGAGIAGAQGSSEIAAGLGLAATALNGPVSVAGNDEGGPTVTYINETAAAQNCVGFTLPYAAIAAAGIDPSGLDLTNPATAVLIGQLEATGGVSVLGADDDGGPDAYVAATANGGVMGAVGGLFGNPQVDVDIAVAAGESVVWTAPSPVTPAAAVIICAPPAGEQAPVVSFGIDKQVVVDQINGTLPGGSIGTGSVSGGSVGIGASLLGSLGGGEAAPEADLDVDVDLEANSGSAGSGADADAVIDVNALNN
ncbi:hypothetical protein [Rhodococcus sp. IEGM 1408]|uniref:hypothetical protein n=1 Tax=Rhodococcus sp. IEGM 1408 TaxID=3082220 RepID=UPI0029550730|nr:hypothetical protein [Rhodococcus sp. IEGM 1408]MDV8001655.1 hypothetical protein [Rhodococcus sp. IEGM 1408]